MSNCIDTNYFVDAGIGQNSESNQPRSGWIAAIGRIFQPGGKSPPTAPSESQARLMLTRDIGPYVRTMRDRIEGWRERRCERRQLMKLDDRMLRDIGISRADAEFEYRKPFWR